MLSSSLSLKDFGDPDRGVLEVTDSGCGLSRIGVSGELSMLTKEVSEPLWIVERRKGDRDDEIGDADAPGKIWGTRSEESIRCPVAMIVG